MLNESPELQAKLQEASKNAATQKEIIKTTEKTIAEEIKKEQNNLNATEKAYLEAKLIYEKRTSEIKYPTKWKL